ncbi:LPS assembly lipoprotein LptE [Undibacterium sp. SXout7W]|uniref:LPS-assembly lipoprotein LptE n=1 Tax=Undibacterium sp. SXout7W TaxID=3413049 RepID=UPI003BF459A7
MRSWITHRKTCLLALLAMMTLSACGFALRGPVSFPFHSIYIGLPDASPLGGELKRQIRANGQTQIASDAKDAEVILDVLSEAREKQILSLNSQGRVREYSLLYRFNFRLRSAEGKEFMEPVTIQLKRTITFNESQVLAKEAEEALLYRDMQTDLVQQVMRRLSVVKMDQ